MLRARNCQGQAVGQQSTCWLLGRNHSVLSYVSRQHNRHNHSCIHGQCVLQRSSPSSRGQQQLAGRCVGQFATRVAAAASTGSTSYSTNAFSAAAPQHYIQHPVSPQVYPSTAAAGQGAVTVTWPGLLAALGLAAAALVAAATTCFFLYIKPVMQAMSVTLTEMEAAAKEMQQAAQEVEELVGGINNTIKQLMQPTALLKWTSSMPSSTTTSSSPSSQSSTDDTTYASATDTSSTSSGFAEAAASPAAGSMSSSSAARQLTDQFESLGPNLLEGLKALQKLQLSDLGAVALKLSGLEDAQGKQQQQVQQQQVQQQEEQQQRQARSRQRRAIRTAAQDSSRSPTNSSSSSSGLVWDMLASSLTTRSTRRSLARLRSDLAAAANVLTVLLAPPSRGLYEQMQQDEQQQQLGGQLRQPGITQQQLEAQQEQQQQQQSPQMVQPSVVSDSMPGSAGNRSPIPSVDSRKSSSSSSSTARKPRPVRRAVQVDEWGLPVTAAEAAAAAAEEAGASAVPATQASTTGRLPSSTESILDAPSAAALPSSSSRHQQQQQQQQPRRRYMGRSSSDEDDAWHMELSQYGSYLEQEHSAVTANKDNGITMQHLQQDASLMQRVFCDNQELAFAQQQQQQLLLQPPQQQEQQEVQPQQASHQNGTAAADS